MGYETDKTVKILKAHREKREAKRRELDAKRAERKMAEKEGVGAEVSLTVKFEILNPKQIPITKFQIKNRLGHWIIEY